MKTLPLLFVVQKWFHLFTERFPSDLNIPQPFFPSYNIASVELLLFCETSVLSIQYFSPRCVFPLCFYLSFPFLLAINLQNKEPIFLDSREEVFGLERANFQKLGFGFF